MHTLVQTIGLGAAAKRELIPLGAAFLIAEFFYKFGSFALECVAFLATWYVLSVAFGFVTQQGQSEK
jgi:hypothetical protein